MISVIVCTYNREKYIYRVLESIANNDFPTERYEIILVDNNCTDNTASQLERFKENFPNVSFRYFLEKNQGLSFARNRGISEAKGDILVYVDDDAFVDSDYLSNYEDIFVRRLDISAAGGPIVPFYESGKEPGWMTYHLKRLLTGYLYFGEKEKEFPGKNYPGGGNAAYRKTVFERVGLYNTELGRKGADLGGGEEKDIFDKMTADGMRFIYIPGSVLHHVIPQYKLEQDYFDRVTSGVGASERLRTLKISKLKYAKRLLSEVVKWGGTIVLALGYTLRLKPQCGKKLLQFRWNVTKNLLGWN